MMKIRRISVLATLLCMVFAMPPFLSFRTDGANGHVHAAEFDIDSGRIILRRLQYCLDCGSALLVTDVSMGILVRCPDCGREQPRLENKYLLTQLYQICKVCSGPLDPHEHQPGDVVRCPICNAKQSLNRDVFAKSENTEGRGFVPGFPPGSGKKKLLMSPNREDARLTAVPLDDGSGELPPPPAAPALKIIPRPPEKPEAGSGVFAEAPMPPLPEEHAASAMSTAPATPTAPATAQSGVGTGGAHQAVNVPAVTADLFGGDALASGDDGKAGVISAGKVMARVDGIPIYGRDVDRVLAPVMQRLRQQAGPGDEEAVRRRESELRREVLERLVDRELVLREADAMGYKPDVSAVRQRESELAQILAGTGIDPRQEAIRDVTMADMRRRYAEKPGAANPKEVREFYQKHKHEMIRPRLIALDQLVVYEERGMRADRRGLAEIVGEITRLLEQGKRFDELRERYDEFCPAAGITHEEPVMQPEGIYSRQILAAGGDLRRGAVFGPVVMSGMVLFGKVVDERPEGPVPFEEVEKDIRVRLEHEAAEKQLDAWIKRLRNKSRVEIL